MVNNLIDGDARQIESANRGKRFEMPSREDRESLIPGCLVKIGVEFEQAESGAGGERFWVNITSKVTPHGITVFTGTVENELVYSSLHGLKLGSKVRFGIANILSIQE